MLNASLWSQLQQLTAERDTLQCSLADHKVLIAQQLLQDRRVLNLGKEELLGKAEQARKDAADSQLMYHSTQNELQRIQQNQGHKSQSSTDPTLPTFDTLDGHATVAKLVEPMPRETDASIRLPLPRSTWQVRDLTTGRNCRREKGGKAGI